MHRAAGLNPLAKAFYVAAGRIVSARIGGVRPIAALHALAYRLLGGRLVGWSLAPVVLLTTRGRRSGAPRTTPVYGIADGDCIVVVGSNAGRGTHPDWYKNLRAEPTARVQVGSRVRDVRARDAAPDERKRLWLKLVRVYPGYAAYRETAAREIPIVILEPAHPSH